MRIGKYELVTAYLTLAQKKALAALKARGFKVQEVIRDGIDLALAKRKGGPRGNR